jgi:protein phosphatase
MARRMNKHKAEDLDFGCRTDTGLVREHNEDNLLAMPPLFCVCDGMGGHEAGEVASEIACNTIEERLHDFNDPRALEQAVADANQAILQAAADGQGREGMGCTCTAAIVQGTTITLAQVGDSRAYLLHGHRLSQLTRDHSLVADLIDSGEITQAEARNHPWRSYITRALGIEDDVRPDMYMIDAAEHDRLLLCSDGLYTMVDDAQIAHILGAHAKPQAAASALVSAAIAAGGADNITVIVVDIMGASALRTRKTNRKTRIAAGIIIAALVAICAGAWFGFNAWVSNVAYLGEVDGKVAVYTGIPGDVLGVTFNDLKNVTEVDVDSLQPGVAERLKKNEIRCDNLAAAWALVDEYRKQIEDAEGDSNKSSSSANNSSSSASASSSTGSSSSANDAAASSSDATSSATKTTSFKAE